MKILAKLLATISVVLWLKGCMNTNSAPPITETPTTETSAPTPSNGQRALVYLPGDVFERAVFGSPENFTVTNATRTYNNGISRLIATVENPQGASSRAWEHVMVEPSRWNRGTARHTMGEYGPWCDAVMARLARTVPAGTTVDFYGHSNGAAAAAHCASRLSAQYHLGWVGLSDGGCIYNQEMFYQRHSSLPGYAARARAADPVLTGVVSRLQARIGSRLLIMKAAESNALRFDNGARVSENHALTNCYPTAGIAIDKVLPGNHKRATGLGIRTLREAIFR